MFQDPMPQVLVNQKLVDTIEFVLEGILKQKSMFQRSMQDKLPFLDKKSLSLDVEDCASRSHFSLK